MLAQFAILMFAAIWILCVVVRTTGKSDTAHSIGFWHALYVLDAGNYGVWEIAKYMVNIWYAPSALESCY